MSALAVATDRPLRRRPRLAASPLLGLRLLMVVALAATALAAYGATRVEPPITNGLGLVMLLPASYWVGLVVLNLCFALAQWRLSSRSGLMATLLVCLVLVVYGAGALLTSVPRGEVSWRHLGIADALASTGTIDPTVDAYFNWPGFFAGLAQILGSTGLSPLHVALVAAVVNGLLWLAALHWMLQALTSDRRRIWLALWLFCLGNWIDQDYLSPQAFALFLYLVVLALLLHRGDVFRRSSDAPPVSGLSTGWWARRASSLMARRAAFEPVSGSRARRNTLVVVVFLSAVIICSHQLTPVMLLLGLAGLTLIGRCAFQTLVLLLGTLFALWLLGPASAYLAGHPVLGIPHDVVSSTLTGRLDGSRLHVIAGRIRLMVTAGMFLVAGVGMLLDRHRGRLDTRPVVLTVAPTLALAAQGYGGEMLLRITLFVLPFLAYFGAGAMLALLGRGVARSLLIFIACAVLAASSVTSRYANARFDTFTVGEVRAVDALYRFAPLGSVLIAGAHPTPWANHDYLTYDYLTVDGICTPTDTGSRCFARLVAEARRKGHTAWMVFTRSNRASLVMQGDLSARAVGSLRRLLQRRLGVTLLYANRDARVYRIDLDQTRVSS